MAEDLDDGEFWLPSQFLTDEDEDEDEGPTCQIPHSKQKEKVMSGSPKSPLCDIGNWSAFSCSSSCGGGSSRGSPICSSLVSSPPSSTPQNVNQEQDSLDLLNAAAGQIGRLKMNEEQGQHRHNHHSELLLGPLPPPPPLKITTPVSSKVKNLPNNVGLYSNQALIQQQLQKAHQFQQLKQQQQQQLLKQQLSAAWSRPGKVVVPALLQQQVQSSGRCARPLGMASPSSTWQQPLHQQLGSGTSRESCGTGVFIPRRRSIPAAETRKKAAAGCPTVLVPAKVVQALNSSLNAVGGDTGLLTSNEHVKCSSTTFQQTRTASDAVILSGQQQHPQNVASHEICLPKEWTY